MTKELQRFQVSLKALMVRDGKLLMVKGNDLNPRWELPGGRIDVGDEDRPLRDMVMREIREELGADLRATIGEACVAWIRYVPRIATHVFLVGYRCQFIGGSIRLSDEHSEFRWVGRHEWPTLDLASNYERMLREFWAQIPVERGLTTSS